MSLAESAIFDVEDSEMSFLGLFDAGDFYYRYEKFLLIISIFTFLNFATLLAILWKLS